MSVDFNCEGMTYHNEWVPGYYWDSVDGVQYEPGWVAYVADGPSLNVSNANAAFLLGLLGFVDDELWDGPMVDATDFLGRVLVAMGLNGHDEGVPGHDLVSGEDAGIFGTVREGGARIFDCGRREGYADERLAILRDLAEYARDRGAKIYWG